MRPSWAQKAQKVCLGLTLLRRAVSGAYTRYCSYGCASSTRRLACRRAQTCVKTNLRTCCRRGRQGQFTYFLKLKIRPGLIHRSYSKDEATAHVLYTGKIELSSIFKGHERHSGAFTSQGSTCWREIGTDCLQPCLRASCTSMPATVWMHRYGMHPASGVFVHARCDVVTQGALADRS